MATTSHTVVIFEGIASVDVDGVAHDTYMTIRTEAVGQTIRWFGSFGWMGKAPKGLFHGEFLDATLSDGRECQIYIPHPPDDNGQVDFLGQKMPPGFEWFQPELVTAELRSTTPAWRVRLSRVLATVALALVITSFWWQDRKSTRLNYSH